MSRSIGLIVFAALVAGGLYFVRTALPGGPAAETLEGERVAPLSDASSVTVLIFVRSDCPVSNRYAPEIQRIYGEYSARGVRFYLVYPDADESLAGIRRHQREYGIALEPLRDPNHQLVSAAGAKVTPEVGVFVGDRLVYAGRIDDWYVDFGKARAQPTHRD
ncbi:MAG: redoxin domain-containing protein, partial [Acidobacteria bacterium]|nr:redoxin domain-containing protein [Acidobacteriota bacterium]